MDIANDDRVYKTFIETYKILTFTMGVGMMYPNPRTEKKRIICIFLIILSAGPVSLMILDDMYRSWLRHDIVNVIRHCTIAGPFLAGFFKMIILFYKRTSAKEIIDEINVDYASYNHLGSTYKNIINRSIASSLKYSERMWTVVVITCVTAFPIMASLSTMYSYLFTSEPQRYMIHDVMIPYNHPDKRFESPIFEIIFVYMLYASALFIINFVACDGFFGVSINHACLKMEIYCNAFEEALKEDNERKMYSRIVEVINAQIKLKRFTDLIQDTFNIWLGLILVATMIQIGNCMYLISEGYALDPRYIIFIVGTVAHIYLPCRYCAKLKYMSVETATLIYCAGWESVPSISTRKMILFMIARAQIPIEITAFNLMVFDMDLFVSIMNSSYSMFTLLRS